MNEKILDRVRKLLELANSSNVNEASNAAGHAQRLMAKHNISQAMLVTPETAQEDILNDLLYSEGGKRSATWRCDLASALCFANGCRYYIGGDGGSLKIVGVPSKIDTVRYLFSYVCREIDRLTAEALSERGNPGKAWGNNFRLGAVESISTKVRDAALKARAEMRQEAQTSDTLGTGAALARVNTAIAKIDQDEKRVTEWVKKNLNLRSGGSRSSSYDPTARAAGRRAGAGINLGGANRGALGSGNRKALR